MAGTAYSCFLLRKAVTRRTQKERSMRYGIYFTPPSDDPLTEHASAWIGRSVFTGEPVSHPKVDGLDLADIAELSAFPRRYGFHATLKAPFRLDAGCSEDGLLSMFHDFCRVTAPFAIPRLVVARLGSFIALVPEAPVAQLNALANNVVRTFEPMRAPLSAAEIARRKPERLGDRQRDYLNTWGYPYVFDEFRFHMTLTGPLDDDRADEVTAMLRAYFAPVLRNPVVVQSLGLYVQEQPDSDFIVRTFCPLSSENLVTA